MAAVIDTKTSDRLYRRRRIMNAVALSLSLGATALGLFWLVWILWTAFYNGIAAMKLSLFTQMTPPPGTEGGLLNAFFGSLVMSLTAILIGAPIGIAAGTYLAEYARKRAIGETIRFVNDILLSAPSIVLGLFIYTIVVRTTGHFSGFAGALALALIVIPVVVRTTDEMLQLVPSAMREAALSLGANERRDFCRYQRHEQVERRAHVRQQLIELARGSLAIAEPHSKETQELRSDVQLRRHFCEHARVHLARVSHAGFILERDGSNANVSLQAEAQRGVVGEREQFFRLTEQALALSELTARERA